ncbi:hypothetical protein MJO28_002599 [Puccinia striiformis f. sp. tritici]|uniref:Uncharacterized protein n=1 Tax=Puccinia striiformis f. sp. tritici TaxID=168172 RepID=A0ACC0EQS1_9BASI|nr:hypothetical protein MJO28_002599 [Puccinia striiformis f. sp. tritici]
MSMGSYGDYGPAALGDIRVYHSILLLTGVLRGAGVGYEEGVGQLDSLSKKDAPDTDKTTGALITTIPIN